MTISKENNLNRVKLIVSNSEAETRSRNGSAENHAVGAVHKSSIYLSRKGLNENAEAVINRNVLQEKI